MNHLASTIAGATALLGACLLLGRAPETPRAGRVRSATQHSEPPLRIALTGYMDGHLEPCGCASAQSGGLDRRAWWFKINKARYDLKLEGGNLVHEDNPLERHKMLKINEILTGAMGYELAPLGPRDLALGSEWLSYLVQGADGRPLLVTDLRKVGAGGERTPPYLTHAIQKAGSYRVLVLSLAGPDGKPEKTGFEVLPPEEAVSAALAKAGKRGEAYDLCVLFVNWGGAPKARELAKSLPGIDLVAAFADDLETMTKVETFERDLEKAGVARTQVLFPGWRGKNILLWEGTPDGESAWVTKSVVKEALQVPDGVPKGTRPPGSDKEVWDMLIQHKREIGDPGLGLLEEMAERKPTATGARYTGNAACAKCHKSAAVVQNESKHEELGWSALVEREKADGWPVTRHPDCVSCHTIGFGEKSGFINATKTPHLMNIGCEACHGPGSTHIEVMEPIQKRLDAGEKISAEAMKAARAKGKLVEANAKTCYRCHNFEQSPGFSFRDMWDQIEHGLDK